jgi:hypothetical protein
LLEVSRTGPRVVAAVVIDVETLIRLTLKSQRS